MVKEKRRFAMDGFDRRTGLKSVLAAGAGALAMGATPASAKKKASLDLSTPEKKFETLIKIIGSLADEPVYTFMRLNVYGDPHNGNFVPLFTMNNLLIDRWKKTSENEYVMTKFEAGYYTEFDSDTPIEEWDNPFTGEHIELINFQLGPVERTYRPGEVEAMAYTPDFLPIEVIGDRVFVASQSIEQGPSFFPASDYPVEAAGSDTAYSNSFMTWSADLADVLDPDVKSAPAHTQIQNKIPWSPWMRMRGRPGGSSLRGFGAKISGLEALPDDVIAGFKKYVPEILQENQWDELVFETSEYLEYLDSKAEDKESR
ncbi:MAG: DUF1838 family protein [Pseudomonadota bacterium]